MTHEELKTKALQKESVRIAYESLSPEFALLRSMLSARAKTGLTQAQIAERMGTKPSAVTRLESALQNGKHSPSLLTLRKYAEALGYRLQVQLVEI